MKTTVGTIVLEVNEATLALSLTASGQNWQTAEDFVPYLQADGRRVPLNSAADIRVSPWHSGVGDGILISLDDFQSGQGGPSLEGLSLQLLAWVEASTEIVRLEVIPVKEPEEGCPDKIVWPGPFEFNDGFRESVTLLNFEQGLLIPNDWPVETKKSAFDGMLNTAGAYMPWFGQILENHEGYLAICETPWNAGFDVLHPAEGPYTHMNVRWEPSLGHLDYRRILQVRFLHGCDVTSMCKEYRRYAIETGRLRTLREKAVMNPSLLDLIGCCFVHAGIKTKVQPDSDFYDPQDPGKNDHLTTFAQREDMVRKIYKAGVRKMYLHLDGWAQPGYDNCHPDYWPICEEAGGAQGMKSLSDTMKELGYMFGIHDQYRDYYRSAESFDENFACRLPDGSIPQHAHWAGGPQSYLCATQAPYYVRRNFERLLDQGIRLDGAYLDVFTCNEGDECDNPQHRMTRRDCYDFRQQCFRYLLSKGILPSSEEVNDWAMPSLVFCHYAPYDFQLAAPGTPKRGIPAPLFNLVYHDCVIEPFMMDVVEGGQGSAGTEDYMLYALLNGQAPYLIRNAAYPNIDGASGGAGITLEKAVSRCQVVQKLHEKVGLLEMVRFEVLNAEGTLQRTTFADGTSVTVDFEKNSYSISR